MRNASNCVYIALQDGVYIRSIYLEGAGWDKRGSVLIEPAPMQLICNMPVIHFRPAELLRKRTRGKTKYYGWNVKITVFLFSFSFAGLYSCPCYYYPQRCGDQGRAAFVVAVDLNAGPEGSDFWIKRGTALLLSLAT